MFKHVKSLFSTPHHSHHEQTTGNINLAGMIVSDNNKIAYRYDSRSPDIIKACGFSGTLGRDDAEVRVFGNNNIFASRTKQGAKEFLNHNKFDGQSKIQFLYEINTHGLKSFSFVDNFKTNPVALVECIANLVPSIPKDQARLYAREALTGQFNLVDELHINGPIPPSRIKHVTTVRIK